ncbi:MAG: hypothetical protein F4Z71_05960, partial [Gammaproteobacteria bacterium]|nr:hypothetical protein [Gammaproteobacteria bacterium]MYE29626.1 hypothetical protein [Gammaproteobacteria bacterium]
MNTSISLKTPGNGGSAGMAWPRIFGFTVSRRKWTRMLRHCDRCRTGFPLCPGLPRFLALRLFAALLLVLLPALLPAGASAQDTIVVSNDWPLIPEGVQPGEKFRLLFVTRHTRDASSTKIADYNSFVQAQARLLGVAHRGLVPYASRFRAVGSTAAAGARGNTSTTGNSGPPIYWVEGAKVADHYGDFYDGSWDSEAARDQAGNLRASNEGTAIKVWTGSADGGASDVPLGGGTTTPAVATAGLLNSGSGTPLHGPDTSRTEKLPFYAISPVFQVKPAVRVVKHPSEVSEFTEGYAGYVDLGVVFLIEVTPATSDSAAAVTLQITDDADADFLAPAEEGPREFKVTGSNSHQHAFETKADPYTALDGTITLEVVKAPEGYEIVGDPVVFKVKDDPGANHPLVTASASVTEVVEGRRIEHFVLTLDSPWVGDDPLVVSAQASSEDPYLGPGEANVKQRTFATGGHRAEVAVSTISWVGSNDDGAVTLTVLGGTGYRTTEASRSATVTVKNDPGLDGRVVSGVEDVSVAEGGGAAFTLEVARAPRNGSSVRVDWITADSTAGFADLERRAWVGTYDWPNGQTSFSFTVPTLNDDVHEGDETFVVSLTAPNGIAFPTGVDELRATGTIEDDADLPELSLSSPTAREGGKLTFKATLSNPSVFEITARYEDTGDGTAQSGARYKALTAGTLTFAAGVTEKEIVVDVLNDQIEQTVDETVILRLSQLENAAFPDEGRTLEATGVIVKDADATPLPQVRLSETVLPVHEGGAAVFTAQVLVDGAVAPWDEDLSVVWFAVPHIDNDPEGATATWGTDFRPINGQITIPAGEVGGPIRVETRKDRIDEETETLGIRILASGSATLFDFDADHWVFTSIHDGASVLIRDAPETAEGQTMAFTVDLGAPAVDDVVLTWSTEDGTATAGADYTAVANGRLTIPAGGQTATLSVTTLQDATDEPAQTLDVVLVKTSGTAEEARMRATGVIRDDDPRPRIGIANVSVTEGDAAQFRISLSAVSEKAVAGHWRTEDGTAVAGEDYVAARGAFTIAPGDLYMDISVVTTDDAVGEDTEEFRVVLLQTPEATLAMGKATGAIVDNDDGLTLSISDAEAREGADGAMAFTVSLSGPATSPVSVDWKTQPTTGGNDAETGGLGSIGRNDYAPVAATTLSFASGEQEKEIAVQVRNDDVAETDETFAVILENAQGATVADGTGTGTILDDDRMDFRIANENTDIDEGGSLTVTVRRSRTHQIDRPYSARPCLSPGSGAAGSATPSFASTASTDDDVHLNGRFSALNACGSTTGLSGGRQRIRFGPDDLEATFTLHTVADDRVEGDETFTIRTSEPIGSLAEKQWFEQTFTIIDDDSRRLRVERSDGKLWEGEKATYELYVDPPLEAGETATVNYKTGDGTATGGQDYTVIADATLNLGPPSSPGASLATVEVVTTEDDEFEADETFTLTFHSPSAGLQLPAHGGEEFTETILDDDRGDVSLADATVNEGGEARVALALSRAIGRDATVTWETVSGAAESPADFPAVANGSLTIAAGETSATILAATAQDTDDEPDETFQVRIKSITPADFRIGDAATVTIIDDDAATLDIGGIADAEVRENEVWVLTPPDAGGMPVGDLNWAVEGTDAARFRIDPATGLPALPAQDYEAPADRDQDNAYEVTLRATDEDGTTATADVTVTVTDVLYGVFHAGAVSDPGTSVEGYSVTFDWEYRPEGQWGHEHGKLNWRILYKSSNSNHALADSADFTGATGGAAQATSDKPVVSVTVQTAQDELDEPDTEYYLVEVFDLTGDVRFSRNNNLVPAMTRGTPKIEDDDLVPTFSVADASATEGDPIEFTVTRAGAAANAVSVDWATALVEDDDAASAEDFEHTPEATTLSFAAGQTEQTVTVATTANTIDDHSRTFKLKLSNAAKAEDDPGGAPFITKDTATGRIDDDDDLPTALTLTLDTDTGTEGAQTAATEDGGAQTVRVTAAIDGASTFAEDVEVTVSVGKSGDTAAEGADYTAVDDFTLTIAAGESSGAADFEFTPSDNDLDENDKTVSVDGTSSVPIVNGTLDLKVTGAAFTLTDDDDPPELSVADAAAVTEGDDPAAAADMTFTVSLSEVSGLDVTAPFTLGGDATPGSDYTELSSTTLTIAAGQSSADITVPILGDTLHEGDEKVTVTLGAPTNASLASGGDKAEGVIDDDDDAPTISVDAPSVAEGNSGASALTFTVTLSEASAVEASVQYEDLLSGSAKSGADYDALPAGTLTFAAGETEGTVAVNVRGDTDSEMDETVNLRLFSPAGAALPNDATQLFATGTIENDDSELSIDDAAVTEGGTAAFTVSLDAAHGSDVTVTATTSDGTATAPGDYAYKSQALTIPAGQTSVAFEVQTQTDGAVEGEETFKVTLSGASVTIADAEGIGAINDAQAPISVRIVGADSVEENLGAATFTVEAALVAGPTTSDVSVTVTVGSATDTAKSGADYEAVSPFTLAIASGSSKGSAEFTLTPIDDQIDEGMRERVSVIGSYIGAKASTAVFITDNDSRGIHVSPTQLTVAERDNPDTTLKENQAVFGVRLLTEPTGDVEIGIGFHVASRDWRQVELSAYELQFTPLDWHKTQWVTFTYSDPDPIDDGETRGGRIDLGVRQTGTDYDRLDERYVPVRITDQDLPATGIELSVDTDPMPGLQTGIDEDGGARQVTVTATYTGGAIFTSGGSYEFSIGKTSDTAQKNVDYTSAGRIAIAIPALAASGSSAFTLTPTDDSFAEDDETITVHGALTDFTVTPATITLNDDEALPVATLHLAPAAIDESGDSNQSIVTASLDRASSAATTVTVSLPAGAPATLGQNATLTIAAGQTASTGTVTVTATDNDVDADAATVAVQGAATGGHGIADPDDATLTIADDDDTPSFSVSDATADEGDAMTFTVTRAGAAGNAVSVDWATVLATGAGAASADDFTHTPTARTLTFAANETEKTVTVQTTEDTLDEPGETFEFQLSNAAKAQGDPGGAPTIAAAAATGTITDDDDTPTFSVNSPTVAEGESGSAALAFKVTLSAASGIEASLQYEDLLSGTARSGTDYEALTAGVLTFAPGDTEKTVTVNVLGDTDSEADETVVLRLFSPTGAGLPDDARQVFATGTIENDDSELSIGDATATEGVKAAFTVSIDKTHGSDVTVTATTSDGTATAPGDYTYKTEDLTIPAGQTSVTFEVQTLTDGAVEGEESFKVTLSGASVTIADAEGIGTIADVQAPLSVSIVGTDSVQENLGAATFTVEAELLAGAATSDMSVSVTVGSATDAARSGADYKAVSPFTVAIASGSSKGSAEFTLTPIDDLVDEGMSERVSVVASYNNAKASTAVFIADDDTRGVHVSPTRLTIAERDDPDTPRKENQAAFGLTLLTEPTGDVEIRFGVTSTALYIDLDTFSLVFTPSNWHETQWVTVTSDDPESIEHPEGALAASIRMGVRPTGTDYDALNSIENVRVSVTDEDLSPSGLALTVDTDPASGVQTSIGEGGGAKQVKVTATFTGGIVFSSNQIVRISVGDPSDTAVQGPRGSSQPGIDYDRVSSFDLSIDSFRASGSRTFTLTPRDDAIAEADETISVLGALTGYTVTPATITLTDDETPPVATLHLNPDTIDESGNDNVSTVTATLDRASSAPVTLTVSLPDNAPAALSQNAVLTVAAGATASNGKVTVTAADNNIDAANVTVAVSAAAAGGHGVADPDDVILTIADDDDAPMTARLNVDVDAQKDGFQNSLSEGITTTRAAVEIEVVLDGESRFETDQTLTLKFGKAGDSAVVGADYKGAIGDTVHDDVFETTITIDAGEADGFNGALWLHPTNDALDEPDEYISIEAAHPTLTVTGTRIVLLDDDGPPTVSVADAAAVTEGDDPAVTADMSFTVSLSAESGRDVTVPYTLGGSAAGGSDYETPVSATLTIPAGSTEGTISVKVKGDRLHEGNETVEVTLGKPTNATVSTAAGAGAASGEITDDDAAPAGVTLTASPKSAAENGGAVTVTVTAAIDGATTFGEDTDVTVSIGANDDSAAEGADYETVDDLTVTLTAGQTSATGDFILTPMQDATAEGSETISVTGDAGDIAVTGDVITLTDDETAPTATLKLAPATIDESGSGNVSTVTATLSGPSSAEVTLTVSLPDGAPATLSDNAVLTIAPGDTTSTGTVTVTAADNDIDAPNANVAVSAAAAGGHGVADPDDVTLTITDDENTPTLTLTLSPDTIDESGAANVSTVAATLSGKSSVAVTVTVAAAPGADTAAGDYTLSQNVALSIAAGATTSTGTVTVTAVDNDVDAPNKTVTVSGTASADSGLADPADVTLTIADDDTAPTGITLSVSPDAVGEAAGKTAVTVTAAVNGNTRYADAKTLTVSVAGGSAEATADYAPVSSFEITLDAASASATGSFDFTPNNDSLDEDNETVDVTGTTADSLTVTKATLAITDNDGLPEVSVVNATAVTEGDDPKASTGMSFAVSLSPVSGRAVTVPFTLGGGASPGSDYTAPTSTSVTIAAGETSAEILVPILGDTLHEGDEKVTVRLGAPTNAGLASGGDKAEGVIDDDDDAPTISVDAPSVAEGNSGTVALTFTATLSAASGLEASVSYEDTRSGSAKPATDYESPADGALTFAPGDTEKTITVNVLGDTVAEGDETVLIEFNSASGASLSGGGRRLLATGTIEDDDRQLSIGDAAAAEGETATFTVSLDSAHDSDVTVTATTSDGTAAAPGDYTHKTQALTIPAGQTSVTFAVQTQLDGATEGDETFKVTLSAASVTIADAEGVGTITDAQAPVAVSIVGADSIPEHLGAGTFTVKVKLLNGPATSDVKAAVTVGAATDTASSGADYTAVAPFEVAIASGSSEGTAMFTLTPIDDLIDEGMSERVSVVGSYNGAKASTAVFISDNDKRGVHVSPTELTIRERDDPETDVKENQAAFGVTLLTEPTGDVEIWIGYYSTALHLRLDTHSLEFTPENWHETQWVTATSNDPDSIEHLQTLTTSVTMSVLPTGTDYDAVGRLGVVATISLTDADLPPPGVQLTVDTDPAPGDQTRIGEGGGSKRVKVTATFTGGTVLSLQRQIRVSVGRDSDSARRTTLPRVPGIDYEHVDAFDVNIRELAASGSGTFTLTPIDDDIDEVDETISVFGTLTGFTVNPATITLVDDDATPVATLNLSPSTIDESGSGNVSTVTASLDRASSAETTITVSLPDGAPAALGDNADLTIAAGATTSTGAVTVTATDNTVDAPNASVAVSGAASGGHGVADPDDATLAINDDDDTPSFSVADADADEGDAVTFTVTRSGAVGNAVSVDWATALATGTGAASADDFTHTPTAQTLTFAAGDTAKTVTVPTTEDSLDESDETFEFQLSNAAKAQGDPGGAPTIAADTATGTINDDDDAPMALTLTLDADAGADGVQDAMAEDGGKKTVRVTATLDGASTFAEDTDVTVTVGESGDTAVKGADYTAVTDFTLTISAGQASGQADFDLTPTDDSLDEDEETVSVGGSLSDATATVTGATLKLTDNDDPPTVSLADAAAVTEGNDPGATADMSFTVNLSAESGRDVTVPYALGGSATGGADYETPVSTTLNIAAGSTEGTIAVKVKGDTLDEPDETVTVTLGAPTNATVSTAEGAGTGEGTITDDDATGVTLSAPSGDIAENGGSKVVTVTLGRALEGDEALDVPLDFTGAAAFGADYALAAPSTTPTGVSYSNLASTDRAANPPTIAFSGVAGAASSATVTLTAATDDIDEGASETVTVGLGALGASSGTNLGGGASGSGTAAFAIADDDTRGVRVTPASLTL